MSGAFNNIIKEAIMANRAQISMYNRVMLTVCISFMVAVFSGGIAYHFLVGSGYFAGLMVNTTLWGSLAAIVAAISAVACICYSIRCVNMYHRLHNC